MKSPEDLPSGQGVPDGCAAERGADSAARRPYQEHPDELTGLPGLRTWRHVYLFVFACFVLWVLLLLGLTVFYS